MAHQENQGQSAARNHALAIAKGEYIGFVDSDDGIHPQMFECLANILDNTEYPFVHCSFHRYSKLSTYKGVINRESLLDEVKVYSTEDGMIQMMNWKEYGHYIWKGLYRYDYIINYTFKEGVYFEDIIWSASVVGDAGNYAYIAYDLYTYRMRDESTVHNLSWDTQKMYFDAIQKYIEIAKEKVPSAVLTIQLLVYQTMIEKCCNYLRNKTVDQENIKEIIKYSKKCEISFKKTLSSKMNNKRKIIFLMSLISFPVTCKIRNFLIK